MAVDHAQWSDRFSTSAPFEVDHSLPWPSNAIKLQTCAKLVYA